MKFLKYLYCLAVTLALSVAVFGADEDFPPRPSPPKLVNDLAGVLNAEEEERLETKLLQYEKESSTQIAVVTLQSIGGYDIAQYGVELFNRWGIGQEGKDNGVLVIAAIKDRKVNITTGYGVEGSLTDIVSGRIIRNEIAPEFKNNNFYNGFDKAADAIIAATKGEYTADEKYDKEANDWPVLIIIFIVIIILAIVRGGGGRGGGGYMSGRGAGDFMTGMLLGQLLGGGRGGGGFGGGGSGGFGGFGGGSSGGGGASGSW